MTRTLLDPIGPCMCWIPVFTAIAAGGLGAVAEPPPKPPEALQLMQKAVFVAPADEGEEYRRARISLLARPEDEQQEEHPGPKRCRGNLP